MNRLRPEFTEKTNKRRAAALLSAAVLFLVLLLATGAQAGFGLDFFDTDTEPAQLEPDGICPTPTPTESESPVEEGVGDLPEELEDPDCIEEPDPTDPGGGNDDGDGDGKGDGKGKGNGDGDGKGNGSGADKDGNGKSGGDARTFGDGNDSGKDGGRKSKDKKKKKREGKSDDSSDSSPYKGKFNATGEYDTDKLQLIATRLRARDKSEDAILEAVYPPFILGGPAAWTNTWGAPRYGPGPIVRTHEGQDVFCKYGDPVLATENGEIEFDDGGLGGRVARLHRGDGSYWYYAHLSDWNTKTFKSGDKVQTGDVIGYCGNTGNAISTPPHVHFGFYEKDGSSSNPMGALVRWLEEAEDRAARALYRITGETIDELRVSNPRLFGDTFAPDISELKLSSESLLAAGSSPESGALGLADTALRAALAGDDGPDDIDVSDAPLEGGGSGEGSAPFEKYVEESTAASD